MYCPHCYHQIPTQQAKCERCGWPFLAAQTQLKPATTAPKQASTIQMTGKQRWYHFIKALAPLIVPILPIIGILMLTSPKNFSLIVFAIIIVLIGAGIYLNKNLSDLFGGIVHVESDQLLKIDRFYLGKRYVYAAFFKRIGSFQIDHDLDKNIKFQTYYTVTYSPNSKKLWKLQPETNQLTIEQLANEQVPDSLTNDSLPEQTILSANQRMQIIKLMIKKIAVGLIIYLLFGDTIENLILWNYDYIFIPNIIFPVLFLVILLLLTIKVLLELIDLISGKLQATSDQLTDLDINGSPGRFSYTATFKQLGKTTIQHQHYLAMIKGERYRIVYSRWSKLVWDVQKIH